MLSIVKNTTKCSILDLVVPYSCRGCGRLGNALCERCKNDILMNYLNYCPKCHEINEGGKCEKCKLPFPTFMVGWRDEKIGEITEEYKFYAVRALGDVLAEILSEILPMFVGEVEVVPLPTIQKHIRERGLDHTHEVAKRLAKRRGWKVTRVLERAENTVQIGAGRAQRKAQAKKAYKMSEKVKINPDVTYILLDDVWTTGASMEAAAEILKKNGARKIVCTVLVVSRDGRKPRLFGENNSENEVDDSIRK